MPQAIIAVAEWVGFTIFSSLPVTVPIATAATIADVAVIATVIAEVAAIAEITAILSPKVGGNYGTQLDFKADPQAGIPYAVGRTAVAGNMIFNQSAGSKSKYLNYATVYTGAGPIDSYESFLVNDAAVTFSADAGEGAAGYYQNRMWRVSQLGASPEASYLHWTATTTGETPANHSGMPFEWSAPHKLSGFAADLWGLAFNTDKYAAGPPKRLTVGKWVKVYDPRHDSTYPGGSGAQRLANEATWAWSENPYLHALTWLIGRTQNGKRILGVGLPSAAIDFPAFVHGANVADANGWKCGGVVYSTDDKYEVLKAFLQAGGGKPMRLGAKQSCLVSAPRTSLATVRTADVVGDPTITGGITRRGRINSIWPEYREEAQSWAQITPDAPVTVASYVTEDSGQVRSRAVPYPLVQNVTQASQLAYYDIANSREFTPVVLPCKPVWMGYQPGDCITADEPEWGLNNQKLLIVKRQRDPMTMQVTLTCASETDAKHAAALALSATGPTTAALSGIDPNVLAQPGAGVFTAAGTALVGTQGTMPELVVTGSSDNVNATDVLVRYRLHVGPGNWVNWPAAPAGSAVTIEITGVADSTVYDLEVAYRSGRGVVSPWTSMGTATAGVLRTQTAGPNLLRYTEFEKVTPFWADFYNPAGISHSTFAGASQGLNFLDQQGTATAGGQGVALATNADPIPVKGVGQLAFQVRGGTVNCTLQTWMDFFDSAGTYISSSASLNFGNSTTFATLAEAMVTPPASAVKAYVIVLVTSVSAGFFVGNIVHPSIVAVPAGQVAFPDYAPGASNDPAADPTGLNVASAVTGQGPWATVGGGFTPTFVDNRTIYQDQNGRILDQRGLPINLVSGNASYRTSWPLSSSSSTSIDVTSVTDLRPGSNITVPSSTISGLSASTLYDVFYDTVAAANLAVATASSGPYFTDIARYLYVGRQATQAGGGGYSPPPPPPPGGHGGGAQIP